MDMRTALSEISRWPLKDRIRFVQQVWDRIADAGWQPELSDDQKAELDRRLAELDANPSNVVSWDSIVEHVRRQRCGVPWHSTRRSRVKSTRPTLGTRKNALD